MHFIYLDESGNTGNNLNDVTQPIFVLGALIVPEEKWLNPHPSQFFYAADVSVGFPRNARWHRRRRIFRAIFR